MNIHLLPQDLSEFKNLIYLDLSNNPISDYQKVGQSLSTLANLKELRIDLTTVDNVEIILRHLPNLKMLNDKPIQSNLFSTENNENENDNINENENENNNINNNINKFNNIKDNKNINEEKIIINTSYEPKKEEINNKKSEKEKKASRAFERFKRVNKSADTGVKPGAAKKSDRISGMAKMLENHMGNKENQEDNILNKKENNNQFNEDIINIINDQPIINKKKKKVKSFSFDG